MGYSEAKSCLTVSGQCAHQAHFTARRYDWYRKTLGSYRDCPGGRGEVEPGAFVRGSFDRIV